MAAWVFWCWELGVLSTGAIPAMRLFGWLVDWWCLERSKEISVMGGLGELLNYRVIGSELNWCMCMPFVCVIRVCMSFIYVCHPYIYAIQSFIYYVTRYTMPFIDIPSLTELNLIIPKTEP